MREEPLAGVLWLDDQRVEIGVPDAGPEHLRHVIVIADLDDHVIIV